jgi:hypothetical protein
MKNYKTTNNLKIEKEPEVCLLWLFVAKEYIYENFWRGCKEVFKIFFAFLDELEIN